MKNLKITTTTRTGQIKSFIINPFDVKKAENSIEYSLNIGERILECLSKIHQVECYNLPVCNISEIDFNINGAGGYCDALQIEPHEIHFKAELI